MIVGVLMSDGGYEKGAEELTNRSFTVGDAEVAGEAGNSRTVVRVWVRCHGDGREGCDRGEVVRVDRIAEGELALLTRCQRMNAGNGETVEVVDAFGAADVVGSGGGNVGLAGSGQRRNAGMLLWRRRKAPLLRATGGNPGCWLDCCGVLTLGTGASGRSSSSIAVTAGRSVSNEKSTERSSRLCRRRHEVGERASLRICAAAGEPRQADHCGDQTGPSAWRPAVHCRDAFPPPHKDDGR